MNHNYRALGGIKQLNSVWNRIKRIKGLADLSAIGTANIGGNAISAVFWLYIAAIIGPEKYGEINYFISIALIASTFCLFGSGYTLTVYTAKKQNLLLPAVIISISSSAIVAVALYLLFEEPSISVYMAGFVIFVMGDATLLGRKMYKTYSITLLLQKACLVALGISLYYAIGPVGIIMGVGLSMMILVWPIVKFLRGARIDFTEFRKKLGFATNAYIQVITKMLNLHLDKLIIASILGFMALGNYHFGLQIVAILAILPTTVFQYVLPQDASDNERPALKKTVIAVSAALSVLGILLAPLVIPAFFSEFAGAIPTIQIMCLSVIPKAIIVMYTSQFLGMEKSRVVLLATLISLGVLVSLIYILGVLYGEIGIATALVLSDTSAALAFLIKNRFQT